MIMLVRLHGRNMKFYLAKFTYTNVLGLYLSGYIYLDVYQEIKRKPLTVHT